MRTAPALTVAAVAVLSTAEVARAAEPTVVFRARSPYAEVIVVDEGPLRFLRFDALDGADQSMIDLRDPKAVPMEYVRVAAAGLAFTEGRSRALVVGLGGGTFPMMLRRFVPGMRVDVVDIDPVVVDVAQRYFGVKPDEKLRITVDDGARYVRATKHRYDLVLLDAYNGDGIPSHLAGAGFFGAVDRVLLPGGVAVANLAIDDGKTERAVVEAFASVFPGCLELRGKERGNVILVGTRAPAPDTFSLRRALKRVARDHALPFPLDDDVESVEACPKPRAPAR